LCRFYGWTPDYVENMSAMKATEYLESAKNLSANEMLRDINVADMPHTKNESRRQSFRKINRATRLESEAISFEDFATKVGMNNG